MVLRRGDQIRLTVRRWPGLDSAKRLQPSDLAAGHLQGPARTRTIYTDHLLSLVIREYQSRATTQSPASSEPAPSDGFPRSTSPEVADTSSGPPSRLGPTPATTAAVDASDSTTSATADTRSSSRTFMTVTPCAARPVLRIPRTPVRCTIPSWEMKTSSWCGRTTSAAARPPRFSENLIVCTPLAPREVLRYSATGVRLPKPFSV